MKDILRQLIGHTPDNNLARCLVREYLQARTLQSLQESGAFEIWAFVGGTALRFLYDMPRFSEDLDFSTISAQADDRFEAHLKKIKTMFVAESYTATVKTHAEKTVKSAFIKFEGLLHELNLSPHPSETLSIKVEIDTRPPEGAGFETSLVRRHCLLHLHHYDRSSLLAGKLHALLCRSYVKGRDIYDLAWYLSDRRWPPPNIVLLNNALRQTEWTGPELTTHNWKEYLTRQIYQLDWKNVLRDVQPFLEHTQDIELLSQVAILKLLEP